MTEREWLATGFAFLAGALCVAILLAAILGTSHNLDRERITCTMARAAMTPKADSLFLQVAPWCKETP